MRALEGPAKAGHYSGAAWRVRLKPDTTSVRLKPDATNGGPEGGRYVASRPT
jgi:hypothetical protein